MSYHSNYVSIIDQSIRMLFEKKNSYRLSEKWPEGQSGMLFCLVLTDSSDRPCTSKWLVFVMKILGYHGNIALKL